MQVDLSVANSGSGFILYSTYIAKFCQDTKSRAGSSSRHLSVLFRSAELSPAAGTGQGFESLQHQPFPQGLQHSPTAQSCSGISTSASSLCSKIPPWPQGLRKVPKASGQGQVHRLFAVADSGPSSWCYPINPIANWFQKALERAAPLAGGDKVVRLRAWGTGSPQLLASPSWLQE